MLQVFIALFLAGIGSAGCMSGRKHTANVTLAFLLGIPVLIGVLSMALADAGIFRFEYVLWLSILWGGVGAWRLRNFRPARKDAVLLLSVLGIGVVSAILFSRPHTYQYGGLDPGEYICTSALIQRTGAIRYDDPFLAALPEPLYPTFCRNPVPPRPTLHAGYLMLDMEHGKMVPDYYHLYPSWLALFQSSGGVESVYRGQTVVAVLAMMVVFLYLNISIGFRVALLATIGLMCNPAILYFGRFPSTELLSMLLLFGCMFCLQQRQDTRSSGAVCVLAVVAFALTVVHIINLVPLFAMMVTCIVYGVYRTDGDSLWDALGIAAGTIIGTLRNAWVTPLFVDTLFRYYVIKQPGYIIGSSLLVACLAWCAWLIWKYLRPRMPEWLQYRVLWRFTAGSLVLTFGFYHYFARPRFGVGHDILNLRSLAWLYSPAALLLCLTAFFLPIRKKMTRNEAVLLVAGGVTTIILLQHKYIQPFYMWAYRRYVPLVIPWFSILLAYTLTQAAGWLRRFKLQLLPYAVFLVVLGWQVYQARVIIQVQEHRGLPEHVERVAEALQEADFVVIDHWTLATPLRIAYGLPVYQLSTEPEPVVAERQSALHGLLLEKLHAGQVVYFVTHSRPFFLPGFHPHRIGFYPHHEETLRWNREGIPADTQTRDRSVAVYQFVAGQALSFENVDYDIGYHSIGLIRGFYQMRRRPDRTMRWTQGEAALYIPGLPQGGTVTLSLSHGRPVDDADDLEVALYLDGQAWEILRIGQAWEDYTLALPPSRQATHTLLLKSATWDPSVHGIHGYPADLGVGVSRIRISGSEPDDR